MDEEAVRWVMTCPPKGETRPGETELQKLLTNAVDVMRDLAGKASGVSLDIATISLSARSMGEEDMVRRLNTVVAGIDVTLRSFKCCSDLLADTYGAVGRLQ